MLTVLLPEDLARRLEVLARATRRLKGYFLREAIAANGSSIRDYRDAHGNAGAFQNAFRAYGRHGKPCLNCGEALTKTTVAGRTTTYCRKCQKG